MDKSIKQILVESMENDNKIHKLLFSIIADLEKRIEKLEDNFAVSSGDNIKGDDLKIKSND